MQSYRILYEYYEMSSILFGVSVLAFVIAASVGIIILSEIISPGSKKEVIIILCVILGVSILIIIGCFSQPKDHYVECVAEDNSKFDRLMSIDGYKYVGQRGDIITLKEVKSNVK